MSNATWSSLHNHSHFSFQDGLSKPEEMVLAAKEKGLASIALTDHGVMHGTADFHLMGKKHDVRTIFGVEAYAIDDLEQWQKERDEYKDDKKRIKAEEAEDEDATNLLSRKKSLYRKGHIVLLAQNLKGLTNLYTLTHRAFKEGFYMKPRIDKKMMAEHAEGVVASSACMGGIIANKCWQMKNGDVEWKDVVRDVEEYREIFGDRFFLELQFNEHEAQLFVNECIVKLHQETDTPLVATNDAHYVNQEDWEAQEILYLLRANKTFKTRGDDWEFKIKQLYIKSRKEMDDTFSLYGAGVPEHLYLQAMENTLLIDGMVEDYEPDTHQRLPTLEYDNPFKKLGEDAIVRLKALGLDKDDRYKERFMHEMKLIREKGFANYFLIMREIIKKAKLQMLVGPGRGSAAGSLICYLNGITDLDPIKHNLLFERFINPDRCFIEGTIVKTDNGFKRIENVDIGETVFTHKNRRREVLSVHQYEKDEDLYCVEYDGSMFICTWNHKILLSYEGQEFFAFAEDVSIMNDFMHISLVVENHVVVQINDIYPFHYRGNVYDLEVDEDHSYQVFGIKSEFISKYKYGF